MSELAEHRAGAHCSTAFVSDVIHSIAQFLRYGSRMNGTLQFLMRCIRGFGRLLRVPLCLRAARGGGVAGCAPAVGSVKYLPLSGGYALPTSFRLSRLRQPHPQPLSILERGGHGAISGPVKDWTTRQKMKIWTRTEGETGWTNGLNGGQQAFRTAGQHHFSIDQVGGWQGHAR